MTVLLTNKDIDGLRTNIGNEKSRGLEAPALSWSLYMTKRKHIVFGDTDLSLLPSKYNYRCFKAY